MHVDTAFSHFSDGTSRVKFTNNEELNIYNSSYHHYPIVQYMPTRVVY